MAEFIQQSAFWGIVLTMVAYEAGIWLQKKTRIAFFNPLLVAIGLVILFLVLFHVDYSEYKNGAEHLSVLLTPATVALAVPLYEQLRLLKNHWKAILSGIFSGVLGSALCILGFSVLFGLSHEQYVTLLPKSITTAIGIGLSAEMGGIQTISVAVIVATGVLGNLLAEQVCRWFRITDPVAKGIAIGTSAHAVGTAKALEMGEIEGAMSSLAIVLAGLISVVVIPIFASFY